MQTITSLVIAFALTFTFAVFPSVSRAQQEHDDPNWRERDLERRLEETKKLQKELDRLKQAVEDDKKKLEEARKRLHKRVMELEMKQRNRFLDIYDYGPTYRNPGLTITRTFFQSHDCCSNPERQAVNGAAAVALTCARFGRESVVSEPVTSPFQKPCFPMTPAGDIPPDGPQSHLKAATLMPVGWKRDLDQGIS
ncbi:MAG TPA: hypothetical protein VGX70_18575 [Gemmataceae bacterium]|jgi:hypothetical protein|nr:hypothetical protein [Gemmataceae bacterium]